jgi:hypothetical protein
VWNDDALGSLEHVDDGVQWELHVPVKLA